MVTPRRWSWRTDRRAMAAWSRSSKYSVPQVGEGLPGLDDLVEDEGDAVSHRHSRPIGSDAAGQTMVLGPQVGLGSGRGSGCLHLASASCCLSGWDSGLWVVPGHTPAQAKWLLLHVGAHLPGYLGGAPSHSRNGVQRRHGLLSSSWFKVSARLRWLSCTRSMKRSDATPSGPAAPSPHPASPAAAP